MAMLTAGDVENMGDDAAREMLAVLLENMKEDDIVATIREVYEDEAREELAEAITSDPLDDIDC